MVLKFAGTFALLSLNLLSGCFSAIEECVAKKQETYRKANPKASYAAATAANEKIRADCEASNRR